MSLAIQTVSELTAARSPLQARKMKLVPNNPDIICMRAQTLANDAKRRADWGRIES